MAATDVRQLSAKQLKRARRVFDIACEYVHLDRDVVKGALTTVNDESTFTVYANDGSYAGKERAAVWAWYGGQTAYREHMRLSLNYERDGIAGSAETTKDSLNLTQYREMYGYAGMGRKPTPAAIARLMDPDYAVRTFIAGVPGQPGIVRCWLDPRLPVGLTIAQRCQWVQGSEFLTGENYGEALHVADQLIETFGGLPQAQPEDWFMANNWDEAKAELRAMLDGIEERVANAVMEKLQVTSLVAPEGGPYALPRMAEYTNKEVTDLAARVAEDRIVHSRVSNKEQHYPDTPEQTLGQLAEWTNLEVHQANEKLTAVLALLQKPAGS